MDGQAPVSPLGLLYRDPESIGAKTFRGTLVGQPMLIAYKNDDERARMAKAVRQFNALLDYLRAISDSVVGQPIGSDALGYCEQILVKLLSHGYSMRKLLPGSVEGGELWDLSSIAAIARCIIETHDAFLYWAEGGLDPDALAFRRKLWDLHALDRREKMADVINSQNPMRALIAAKAETDRAWVVNHPLFKALPEGYPKKVTKGDAPSMVYTPREMCERFGLSYAYYQLVTMQLSQHVHTFPYSVEVLRAFQAGSDGAARSIQTVVSYTLPFLAKVADVALITFAGSWRVAPVRTQDVIAEWLYIYRDGIGSK